MRALALALAIVATPAMAADQFDLVCTGDDEPWHYRIDLEKGEWCTAKCETTFKIVSVTSGTLVLQEKRPQVRNGDTVLNSISRSTGDWYFYRVFPNTSFIRTVNGKCEPAPFSGMPIAKF